LVIDPWHFVYWTRVIVLLYMYHILFLILIFHNNRLNIYLLPLKFMPFINSVVRNSIKLHLFLWFWYSGMQFPFGLANILVVLTLYSYAILCTISKRSIDSMLSWSDVMVFIVNSYIQDHLKFCLEVWRINQRVELAT